MKPGIAKTWLGADRVAALLFLLVVAFYGWQTWQFTATMQSDVVGPSFYPRVLALAGLVLGLMLLFKPAASAAGEDSDAPPPQRDLGAVAPALLLLGYVFALQQAGFPLATVVFLAVSFRLLGEGNWWRAAGWSLMFTATIFAIFYYGLGLKLPLGPLVFLK